MQLTFKLKFLLIFLILLNSCKEEWLDEKQDKMQVIPHSLKDLQALMDNTNVINRSKTPAIGEVSADDYYISYESWESIYSGDVQQKNAYIWKKNIFEDGGSIFDWEWPYRKVFYTNVVLEGLENIDPSVNDLDAWNNLKGTALFHRAWAFYQLAQLFCKQYDPSSAATDLGIPLRLEPDVNLPSVRVTVQQTYDRIIEDIDRAIDLLPNIPAVKTRPSKAAAYAFLSRVYLQMGVYDEAIVTSDKSLNIYNTLIDYNTVDITEDYPFEPFNKEVIFHTSMSSADPLSTSRHNVDSLLYKSYDSNDLRKQAFFTYNAGALNFKGTYSGSFYYFSGIATDEVYLIRAECYARIDEKESALKDLNTLLKKRYSTGSFIPVVGQGSKDILALIIKERRKELLFRGMRWSDLRRLNKEPEFSKTLIRKLNGIIYTLPPQDARYTLPIPPEVIDLSGMSQNPR